MKSNCSIAPETIRSAYPIIKETVPKSERGYNTNNKYAAYLLIFILSLFFNSEVLISLKN